MAEFPNITICPFCGASLQKIKYSNFSSFECPQLHNHTNLGQIWCFYDKLEKINIVNIVMDYYQFSFDLSKNHTKLIYMNPPLFASNKEYIFKGFLKLDWTSYQTLKNSLQTILTFL